MDQRISLITVPVDDLDREKAFDVALGWEVTDETDDPVVFDLLGATGFFATPGGQLWEVAHNPFAPLADDGRFRWRGFEGDG